MKRCARRHLVDALADLVVALLESRNAVADAAGPAAHQLVGGGVPLIGTLPAPLLLCLVVRLVQLAVANNGPERERGGR